MKIFPDKKRIKKIGQFLLFALPALLILCFIGNNMMTVARHDYVNSKIPPEFNGFKILQISDLHNMEFGRNQKALIQKTDELAPDIIVVTGDFFDRSHTDIAKSLRYIEGLEGRYPIYYVTGNHEADRPVELGVVLAEFERLGVRALRGESVKLNKDGSEINIIGLDDPLLSTGDCENYSTMDMEKALKGVREDEFKLLLAHRPELLRQYEEAGFDLILSGHAHGGQIRIPFTNIGLFAPGQGFFAKYAAGRRDMGESSLIVSRGLGNSIFPVRVFNQPELVLVTLYNSEDGKE